MEPQPPDKSQFFASQLPTCDIGFESAGNLSMWIHLRIVSPSARQGISLLTIASFVIPFAHLPGEDHFDDAFRGFDTSLSISPHAPDYPTEFMKSVLPIPCHSHNDYWRQRPLYSALGSGCISVEADIWKIGKDIFVAHTMDQVVADRTLESMYIQPLIELLDHFNSGKKARDIPRGLFYQNPTQTLVLVIDMKTPGTWEVLQQKLQPLRERGYLTYWNGEDRISRPVTIVASGVAPFELLAANQTYRDIFYDAPLEALNDCPGPHCSWSNTTDLRYDPSNSYYASSSLVNAVGSLHGFALTESQLDLMRQQVRTARERGLVPRYWGTPRWPRGLRDEIWSVLLQADVGVLNVDDLRAARKGTWGSWPQRSQHQM